MRLNTLVVLALVLSAGGYYYHLHPTILQQLGTSVLAQSHNLLKDDAATAGDDQAQMAPDSPSAPLGPLSPFAQALVGKLATSDGAQWIPTSAIKYYALYFSASRFPYQRQAAAPMVAWYKSFKPSHRNFELVFISGDEDEAQAQGFMKIAGMSFPAVRHSEIASSGLLRFSNDLRLDLVLIDSEGKVVAQVGPGAETTGEKVEAVRNQIELLVPTSTTAAQLRSLPRLSNN